MHASKTHNKLKNRAFELTMSVKNVLESKHAGIISDTKVSEILFDLAEKNQDLILHEHDDEELRDIMRPCRIMLLPFSDRSFML